MFDLVKILFRIAVVVVIFNKIYASVVVISQLSFFWSLASQQQLSKYEPQFYAVMATNGFGFPCGAAGESFSWTGSKIFPDCFLFCFILFC